LLILKVPPITRSEYTNPVAQARIINKVVPKSSVALLVFQFRFCTPESIIFQIPIQPKPTKESEELLQNAGNLLSAPHMEKPQSYYLIPTPERKVIPKQITLFC